MAAGYSTFAVLVLADEIGGTRYVEDTTMPFYLLYLHMVQVYGGDSLQAEGFIYLPRCQTSMMMTGDANSSQLDNDHLDPAHHASSSHRLLHLQQRVAHHEHDSKRF